MSRKERLQRILAWLFFVALSVAALVEGLVELDAEIRSYRWETTRGEVDKVEVHRAVRHVYYTYTIGEVRSPCRTT